MIFFIITIRTWFKQCSSVIYQLKSNRGKNKSKSAPVWSLSVTCILSFSEHETLFLEYNRIKSHRSRVKSERVLIWMQESLIRKDLDLIFINKTPKPSPSVELCV